MSVKMVSSQRSNAWELYCLEHGIQPNGRCQPETVMTRLTPSSRQPVLTSTFPELRSFVWNLPSLMKSVLEPTTNSFILNS